MSKIFLIIFLLVSSIYAKNIATVTAISGKAFVKKEQSRQSLKLGHKLQEKDIVLTGNKTKVQIIFKDDTIITLGKNAYFSIDEYLFDKSNEPVAKFRMLSGAMRTITGQIGKIAPDKFSVRTKTATIGIRGTNFTLLINRDGSQEIFCTFGEIYVVMNNYEHNVNKGEVLTSSLDAEVKVKKFNAKVLKSMKQKNFSTDKSSNEVEPDSAKEASKEEGKTNSIAQDDSMSIMNSIDSLVVDAQQTEVNSLTNSSVIAGYSMSNAVYSGTYTTTLNNNPSFLNSGPATMSIDFGADTANLTLGVATLDLIFDANPTGFNTNTFGLDQTAGNGKADGSFYGKTGNEIKGTFDYDDATFQSVGTYKATSLQELN